MKYRKGYKYQLAEDMMTPTNIIPPLPIYTQFVDLTKTGLLIQRSGYACDGPSGPTIDTKSSIRGAFVHDGLYQLIRQGYLPMSMRKEADEEAYRIWIEDGMMRIRAKLWLKNLNAFAKYAADPRNIKKVYEAP